MWVHYGCLQPAPMSCHCASHMCPSTYHKEEIMAITEEWFDTENIDLINLNVLDPNYIHLDSGIKSRLLIRSKEELKDI